MIIIIIITMTIIIRTTIIIITTIIIVIIISDNNGQISTVKEGRSRPFERLPFVGRANARNASFVISSGRKFDGYQLV